MRFRIITPLFCVFLLHSSCNGDAKETEQLNEVLLGYDNPIPYDSHIYILRSNFSCKGCVQSVFLKIDSILEASENKITIVSSNKSLIPKSLLSKVEFLEDSLCLVDKVFYDAANVIIIETNHSKIVNFERLNEGNDKKISETIKAFFGE